MTIEKRVSEQERFQALLDDNVFGSTIEEQQEFKSEGFRVETDINYKQSEIYKAFPKYSEEYIDKRIEKYLNDSYQDNYVWDCFDEDMANFNLDVLDYAEDMGLIMKKYSRKTNKDNTIHEYCVSDFEAEEIDYTRYRIKLNWSLLFNPDDLYNEYDEIQSVIENEDYYDIPLRIMELKQQLDANSRAIYIIGKCEEELDRIYNQETDVTEDIIYRIEENNENDEDYNEWLEDQEPEEELEEVYTNQVA